MDENIENLEGIEAINSEKEERNILDEASIIVMAAESLERVIEKKQSKKFLKWLPSELESLREILKKFDERYAIIQARK